MDLDERRSMQEWLRSLESDPDALARVCSDSGSLVQAAWRIARARCGTAGPSASALCSVAQELAVRVGYFDALPDESRLTDECLRWGLFLAG